MIRQAVILCALAAVPALFATFFHPRLPNWDIDALREGEVYLETVHEWESKPLWVDARYAKEYDKEHVDGALSLNAKNWETNFERVMDVWEPDAPIVVYCDDTACQSSHHVAKRLRDDGFSPVYVLKYGWGAWQKNK